MQIVSGDTLDPIFLGKKKGWGGGWGRRGATWTKYKDERTDGNLQA